MRAAILILLLMPSLVSADLYDFLESNVEYVNDNIDQVPGFIRTVFGDERINAAVELKNETNMSVSVITDDARITSFEKGKLDDATMDLWVSETTIEEVLDSSDPAEHVMDAIDDGSIRYETHNIASSVKMGLAKGLMSMYSWLRGLA